MRVCSEGKVSLDVTEVLHVVVVSGEGGGGVLLVLDAKFSCWRWLATTSSLTNLFGKDDSLNVEKRKDDL